MAIAFEEVDVPVGDTPADDTFESTDYACEVCGKPLVYSGRGRKPKRCDEHKRGATSTGTGVRRNSAQVESAMRTMESVYGTGDMVLLGLNRAAEAEWSKRVPALLEQDRILFEADPALCKRINGLTARGSMGIFIGMHLSAIVPVAMIVYGDVQARSRAARLQREARAAAAKNATGAPFDATTGEPDPGTYGPGAKYL